MTDARKEPLVIEKYRGFVEDGIGTQDDVRLVKEWDTLTADLARAEEVAKEARAVVQMMRTYMPTPGENPGETRIRLSEWEPLIQRIEALEAPTPTRARDESTSRSIVQKTNPTRRHHGIPDADGFI